MNLNLNIILKRVVENRLIRNIINGQVAQAIYYRYISNAIQIYNNTILNSFIPHILPPNGQAHIHSYSQWSPKTSWQVQQLASILRKRIAKERHRIRRGNFQDRKSECDRESSDTECASALGTKYDNFDVFQTDEQDLENLLSSLGDLLKVSTHYI